MDNLIEPNMLNVVFNQRNQKYGAYELRINYEKRLKKSFVICILFLASLITIGFLVPNQKIKSLFIAVPSDPSDPDIISIIKNWDKDPVENNSGRTTNETPTQIGANPIVFTPTDSNASSNNSNNNGDGTGDNHDENLQPKTGGGGGGGGSFPAPKSLPKPTPTPMTKPDILPQFPGGSDALSKFLDDNLPYVNKSYETQKVIVQFVVEQNGEISEIQIIQDSGTESGDEIIGVINKMPN
ncbi:MAG: hypothetical protein HYZ42_03095, partial [Bacteroidetes bacterium]|nr:hypothetical protein [Bacteroidota bacterium]